METIQPLPAPPSSLGGEERTWATFTHLSALSAYLGVPFGNLLGPLLLWLLKKDAMPFVADQGKEALNFQLSMLLYGFVAAVSIVFLVGLLALPVLFVAHIVLTIVASVQASEGKLYRYPFTIRFVQ